MKSLAAALIFFTRLPLWRIYAPPKESFRNVIHYWSVTGWLTAAVTAGTLWLAGQVLSAPAAVLAALAARMLLTGALHEDGLADFFDSFGAGGGRERILAVMKDSHIGTYGVTALIIYFGMMTLTLCTLPTPFIYTVILVGDPLCKFIASHITALPYARTEDGSKSGVVYTRYTVISWLVSAFFGLAPMFFFLEARDWGVAVLPLLVFGGLLGLMKKKIGGYTGDCCGAMFLLCELAFYLFITTNNVVYIR
jgi:adenosylcobinamide-GDP ribazoletransferase